MDNEKKILKFKNKKEPTSGRIEGFTLIELLIVIGILAILAAIVIVAINPVRQFGAARNAQRWTNINTILNAVHQRIIDNKGSFNCSVGALPSTATTMRQSGGYDICSCLVPTYIAAMPYDPQNGSYTACASYNTDYRIMQDTNNRITIDAPSAEISESISVTR